MSKKDNSVSREKAREITADIQAAVLSVIKKHGLDIETTKTSFGDFYEFKVRASAVEKVNGVNIASEIAKRWILESYFYGFSQDEAAALLGTPFVGKKVNGQEVLLAGFNPRKKKMPFIGQTADGKQWELSEQAVRSLAGFNEADSLRTFGASK